jgi:hypothetical protein
MFDTVFGLPVHALVLHAVVVLVPLTALGVVAVALVPRWRPAYRWPVLAAATLSVILVPVTTQSGERLQERLGASGVVGEQIARHQMWGDRVIWAVLAMWIVTAALLLLDRRQRQEAQLDGRQRQEALRDAGREAGRLGGLMTGLAVLAVLTAAAATGAVAMTGHTGTTAVWSCTVDPEICSR